MQASTASVLEMLQTNELMPLLSAVRGGLQDQALASHDATGSRTLARGGRTCAESTRWDVLTHRRGTSEMHCSLG